jgi:hypothetical protein
VNWAELERNVVKLKNLKRKSELEFWFVRSEQSFADRVLTYDKNSAKFWVNMIVEAKKSKTISALDSIIAAKAKASAFSVMTRNVREFGNAGDAVINPWELN